MEEKCPCQIYATSCCACVSMHCDECHGHSKFVQGRFCSNCGRPLKGDVDWHREAELNAQRIIELEAEKDALIKNYAECMKDYAREIFEEMDGITELFIKGLIGELEMYDRLAELKKKHTKPVEIVRDLAEEAVDNDIQNHLDK